MQNFVAYYSLDDTVSTMSICMAATLAVVIHACFTTKIAKAAAALAAMAAAHCLSSFLQDTRTFTTTFCYTDRYNVKTATLGLAALVLTLAVAGPLLAAKFWVEMRFYATKTIEQEGKIQNMESNMSALGETNRNYLKENARLFVDYLRQTASCDEKDQRIEQLQGQIQSSENKIEELRNTMARREVEGYRLKTRYSNEITYLSAQLRGTNAEMEEVMDDMMEVADLMYRMNGLYV